MRLPGQLKDTTLGDLLGALFREKADGILELLDRQGGKHRIELCEGRVKTVETDMNTPLLGDLLKIFPAEMADPGIRFGEQLLRNGLVNEQQLSSALRRQNLTRLEKLFALKEANIRFRAPRPRIDDPTAATPLDVETVLKDRPRRTPREGSERRPAVMRRVGALSVLGLGANSTDQDIRRAFRSLAAEHHPDRHPGADARERTQLMLRFAEISRAYHTLTG